MSEPLNGALCVEVARRRYRVYFANGEATQVEQMRAEALREAAPALLRAAQLVLHGDGVKFEDAALHKLLAAAVERAAGSAP